MFFSTQIGFGTFVTNAGVLFEKANPYWTSIGYVFVNLIVGILAVLIVYMYGDDANFTINNDLHQEYNLFTVIYDFGLSLVNSTSSQEGISWLIVIYCMILFSGFISMVSKDN